MNDIISIKVNHHFKQPLGGADNIDEAVSTI